MRKALTTFLSSLLLMSCFVACGGGGDDDEVPVIEECKYTLNDGLQSDGWTDSGTSSYYKENEASDMKSWIEFGFEGTSESDKCTSSKHYYIYSTVEDAKLHYDNVCTENPELNPSIDSNLLTFEESEFLGKTKKEIKILFNVEEAEPELKVDTTQLGGRWILLRDDSETITSDGVFKSTHEYKSDKDNAKWESFFFDSENKTFSKEYSYDKGVSWYMPYEHWHGTYTLYLYNAGTAMEQCILVTKDILGNEGQLKILKLNSKELILYSEFYLNSDKFKDTYYYEKQ